MLYLVMVVVFLIAGILLMLWNRGREKNGPGHIDDSGMVTLKSLHLPTRRPKIKRQSNTDASLESKIQVKMWYYSIDGDSKHGPITEDELRRLLSSRRLLPDTLVWTQGLPCWSEASTFKMLVT